MPAESAILQIELFKKLLLFYYVKYFIRFEKIIFHTYEGLKA